MISDARDITDNNIMYLFISHGVSVSHDHNYYPFIFNFRSGMMYSEPLKQIFEGKLEKMRIDPCYFLTGSCPFIPVKDVNNNNIVYYLYQGLIEYT